MNFLFLFLGLALPFDLQLTRLGYLITGTFLGEWGYLVLQPALLFCIFFCLKRENWHWKPNPNFYLFLFITLGFCISSFFHHIFNDYSFRLILLGLSVTIFALIWPQANSQQKKLFFKGFFFSFAFWSLLAFISYVHLLRIRYPNGNFVCNQSLLSFIIYCKGFVAYNLESLPTVYFFKVIGNTNRAANFIVLTNLLIHYFWQKKTLPTGLFILFSSMIYLMFVMTFSRGALLTTFGVGVLLIVYLVYSYYKGTHSHRLWISSILLILPLLMSLSHPILRGYWQDTGTIKERLEMWDDIRMDISSNIKFRKEEHKDQNSHDLSIYFGYGTGNYGLLKFDNSHTLPHNVFLNLWTEGGILALFAWLIYILGRFRYTIKNIFYSQWPNHNHLEILFSFIILLCVCVLGLRNFAFFYVYQSNFLALLFVICMNGFVDKRRHKS